ncbi:VOC family protein [Sphaerisporangium sp. NPDC005288]|uniref:VOC family protein n=2 Tax=unclassified Sphaerisporangium TaxID=2630420 RepID=UPI0033B153DC
MMDALYPRLLVSRFPECFRFYDGVLTEALGGTRAKGEPSGPYANWGLGDQSLLSLLDRAMMAGVVGDLRPPAPSDAAMLVLTVGDVDAAAACGERHGGRVVAAPAARPEWGPTVRTAHLRDPDGNLLEFQSY